MIRFSPAKACEKSSAAKESLFAAVMFRVDDVSLRKATKPPLDTCRTSWCFAGFCAAAARPMKWIQSARVQILFLIRGPSLDDGEFNLIRGFETYEAGRYVGLGFLRSGKGTFSLRAFDDAVGTSRGRPPGSVNNSRDRLLLDYRHFNRDMHDTGSRIGSLSS